LSPPRTVLSQLDLLLGRLGLFVRAAGTIALLMLVGLGVAFLLGVVVVEVCLVMLVLPDVVLEILEAKRILRFQPV
jgi:hypothetical protein